MNKSHRVTVFPTVSVSARMSLVYLAHRLITVLFPVYLNWHYLSK